MPLSRLRLTGPKLRGDSLHGLPIPRLWPRRSDRPQELACYTPGDMCSPGAATPTDGKKPLLEVAAPTTALVCLSPLWGKVDLCKLVGRYPTLNNIACYTVAVNRKFWGVVFWLPLMARRSAAGLTGAAQRRRSGATPTPTGPGAGGLRKRPKGPL